MKITLCGSTRFRDAFDKANAELSLQGHTVYTCALWGHAGDSLTANDKLMLDAVHFAKIANSDAILVLNVDDYIGESTRREIYFANAMEKEVRFLEDTNDVDINTRYEVDHSS